MKKWQQLEMAFGATSDCGFEETLRRASNRKRNFDNAFDRCANLRNALNAEIDGHTATADARIVERESNARLRGKLEQENARLSDALKQANARTIADPGASPATTRPRACEVCGNTALFVKCARCWARGDGPSLEESDPPAAGDAPSETEPGE